MSVLNQPDAVVDPVGSSVLLRHPPYLFYVWSRCFSRFSSQIAAVARWAGRSTT